MTPGELQLWAKGLNDKALARRLRIIADADAVGLTYGVRALLREASMRLEGRY